MSGPNKKEYGFCPDCDSRIKIKAPRLGQKVTCHACGTVLEVVDTSPLELDWAFDEGLDFDELETKLEDKKERSAQREEDFGLF